MTRRKWVLAITIVAVVALAAVAGGASLDTKIVLGGEHTTDSDFQNGTLTDLSVEGSGTDGRLVASEVGDDIDLEDTNSTNTTETFQLSDYDSVEKAPAIDLTGKRNSKTVSDDYVIEGSDSKTIDISGTDQPTNATAEVTNTTPIEEPNAVDDQPNKDFETLAGEEYDLGDAEYVSRVEADFEVHSGRSDSDILLGFEDDIEDFAETSASEGSRTLSWTGEKEISGGETKISIDVDPSYSDTDYDITWETIEIDVKTPHEGNVTVEGEVVEEEDGKVSIDLEDGDTISADEEGGSVTTDITRDEHTDTVDPGVTLNGNTQTYEGTLPEGDTTTLTWDESDLNKNDDNELTVSLPNLGSDAPPMTVGYDFRVSTSKSFGSPEYLSEPYDLANVTQLKTNVSVNNADGTFELQKNDGSGWSTVDTQSITSNGTLTIDTAPIDDADEVRARVTFDDTGSNPFGTIHSDRAYFQAHAPRAMGQNVSGALTDTVNLNATVSDYEMFDPQGDSVDAQLYWANNDTEAASISGVTSPTDVEETFEPPAYGEWEYYVEAQDDYGLDTNTPTYTYTGGPPTFEPGSGLSVDLTGASSLSDGDIDRVYPYDNTVQLRTEDGDVDFIAGGDATADIDASEISGGWTNVTGVDASENSLQIDPGDKPKVTVDGAAESVAIADYALDDGDADLEISGPDESQSDVTFHDLEADTELSAVDGDGNVVDVQSTDANGQVTFTVRHSTDTLYLQEGDKSSAPTQENPSPEGSLQEEPGEFSIDVDDEDFAGYDNVSVEISYDGTVQEQVDIESPQTVQADIPDEALTGGEHEWQVNTTDRFDNTRIEQYEYKVPDTLTIYNESNPDEQIDDPIESEVRFYGSDTDEIYERTTDSGELDLTDLPVNEPLIVEVDASDEYTARTVFFEAGGIYDQQRVYLLPKNDSNIESRFTLDDPTGTYGESSIMKISRALNRSGDVTWETIYADQFGVEGVQAFLAEDTRYRLEVQTQDGEFTQDLGPYRSSVTESVEVQPSAPGVTFEEERDQWGYGAELDNTSLTWSYYDRADETDSLTIWIHDRGNPDNQLTANQTHLNLGNVSGQETLTENETETEWVVNFVVDRNGEDTKIYSTVPSEGREIFPSNLDDGWRAVVGVGLLVMFAGSLSVVNVAVGGVVFGLMGGVLWYLGWLGGITSGAAIAAYLLIAIGVYIMKGGV